MAEAPKPVPKPPLEDRIRALEARRKAGESVPELDRAYQEMDKLTDQGYKGSGGKKAGGSIRGGGVESRGKTKGRMV